MRRADQNRSIQARMKPTRYPRWSAGAVALAVLLAACGSGDSAAEPTPWGSEAEAFFDELSRAYTENDLYGVLDFYAPSAHVEKWRGDNKGGGPVSDLLVWNSGDLALVVQALHLGATEAVALVRWPSAMELGAVVGIIEDGLIAHETVFDLAASQGRSQRASPEVISAYESLYADYAAAWTSGTSDSLADLYSPEATVRDELSGIEATGLEAISGLPLPGRWVAVTATDVAGDTAPAEAPPVYLGPAAYGQDPQRAVGIYGVADGDGCERQIAVRWLLAEGLIVEEHRYQEIESVRSCAAGGLPSGWWSGLALPGPRDQVVTGFLRSPGGQEIAVHNGTPSLEELVQGGLERFAAAGLAEPRLDSVTFEPSRGCDGVSGRVDDAGAARELFLCIYESDLCPGDGPCPVPALSVRVAVLHELGHAWLLDNLDTATRDRLLELSNRKVWRQQGVAWSDQGVEYSAEVLAWGLATDSIPMVRLGGPPCPELRAAFELLTAVAPLRDLSECPDS
jgi:ketosteroid isomerase-like protein